MDLKSAQESWTLPGTVPDAIWAKISERAK